MRPTSFLPVGTNGSTEALTKEIGFNEDLPKARRLLAEAGLPNGFKFQLAYGNAAIAGVTYQNLAQKIQADLARVGIVAELAPMDQVNLRTMFLGGKAEAVLTFWNPPAPENWLWTSATVNRVARRVVWDVPADMHKLVADAGAATTALKDYYSGLSLTLATLLVSPEFLFRADVTEPGPDGTKRLTAYSKASRLSFFIWNSAPDGALLQGLPPGLRALGAAAVRPAWRLQRW